MKKLLVAIALLAIASASASAQEPTLIGSWPAEGGQLTIKTVGGTVDATSLDFISANNGLLPIGPADVAPFQFLLANNNLQVKVGNLGSSVLLDGAVTLGVAATADAQLAGFWYDGTTPVPFDIIQDKKTGPPVVPEPASGTMALLLLASLCGFRRRRV